jgi:hypothetical protein
MIHLVYFTTDPNHKMYLHNDACTISNVIPELSYEICRLANIYKQVDQ